MNRFAADVYVRPPSERPVRINEVDGLFYQASISPNGDAVVFFGGSAGRPRLWHHDLTIRSGQCTPITPSDSGAHHPAFDWTGTRIAFASDRASPIPGRTVDKIEPVTRTSSDPAQMHIFTAFPDGSNVEQVTEGPYRDRRPSFSPDGRWIIFSSDRRTNDSIWMVRADGSSAPRFVPLPTWGYRPSYTTDGKSILYYGPDERRQRIWKFSFATGSVTRLEADDFGDSRGPIAHPGREDRVLVHSTRGGGWGLWELPLNDAGPVVELTPSGFAGAAHPSISRNDVLAFDLIRK